jgi:uncharacterized protein (DUF58 family)
VGLLLFSDKIEKFIPPKKGKSHILRILRELINTDANTSKTDLGAALKYFNNVIKKRAITFLISDYLASASYQLPLTMAAKKHDFIGMQIHDINDRALPDVGLIRAVDDETGQIKWIDTSNKSTRKSYSDFYTKNIEDASLLFKKSGADLIQFNTQDGYIKTLKKFFKMRATKK